MPPPSKAARINELVGKRTGRTAQVNRAVGAPTRTVNRRRQEMAGAGRQAIATMVRHSGGKLPAAVRKEHQSWTGPGLESVDPYIAAQSTHEALFNKYSKDIQSYNRQVTDANATKTAYAAQVLDQQVDPNAPETFKVGDQEIKLAPSIDEQYLGGNLQKYVTTPIARAGAAIPNTLIAGAEAGYKARDEGAGYWEQTLEGLKAGAGAWNESIEAAVKPWDETDVPMHGFGDLYETVKNKGDSGFSDATQWLEREHPFVEQQVGRTAGALGDWYGHPLGRMVGGGSAGVIGGKLATPESIRSYANDMAKRWAADAESQIVTGAAKAPGGYRTFPSEAAMADHFNKTLTDVIDTAELQINAGGSKGRYNVLSPKMTAGLAGVHGSQALLESLTSLFSDRTQRLVDGMEGRGPKLSGNSLDHWASLNPDFTELLDDVTNQLINDGRIPANASRDMVANVLTTGDTKLVRDLEQGVVDRHYTPYIKQASDDITREFRNSYYNTPGIRVGNKVIPVKGVGKAFATIESKFFDDIGKNFRYNSVFPGSLSLDTTRMRAYGVRATEEFEKLVREQAAPFSKADGIAMQHAIENNAVHLLPPDQQVAAQWIKDKYKEMFDEEFTSGSRGRFRGSSKATTPYDPNYAFVHNKGGTISERRDFKGDNRKGRKGTIHENVRKGNGQGAGRFKTANAKDAKLRPVENAFEALRQRRIKHNRDMIRARFLNDMIDKYGIHSRVNPAGKGFAAEARGLSKIDFQKLPEATRQLLERTGEDVFLPREMNNMVKEFDNITRWHSGEQGRIGRSFAEVMRVIKKGMTLPWPGFHNKNMIGDIFMGLLDHILPKDYAIVIAKGMAALSGKGAGVFKILKEKSGLDLDFRTMWQKYQSEANSGFISSELGNLEGTTAKYNIPRKIGGKLERIALGISGFREDAGRFTHYVTSYRQEARELWRKGERNLDTIENKASSAALWRVNNYKFDYNALMLWEKKTKTLAFPFYTFMRKAAPTLFQALYQDPRWISSWTRYMYQHQMPDGQDSAGSFDGFSIPSDMRDAGYAFIGGQQDEPTYVSNEILPTSVFNSVRTKNPHEFFNSLMSQVALPYQIAAEQGSGQQYFQDRPLKNEGFGDYLLDKVPGVREVRALTDSDKSWGEKLLTGRIGAGLPIKQLSENQQLFAKQEWQDRMIDEPLKQVNYSQDLFFIARQTAPDGKAEIFTVKNKMMLDPQGNATDVASYYTPEEAIQYVRKNLPDSYKKVPKTWDVDNQGNPVYREVGT